MKKTIYFLSFLLIPIFASCYGQAKERQISPGQIEYKEIDSLGNGYLELNRFSGVILVAVGDSIIYKNSFGLARRGDEQAFSHKTAFKIGEASKLITAGIIRKMAGEGKVNLSQPISHYVPEIQLDHSVQDLLEKNISLPVLGAVNDQEINAEESPLEYVLLAFESTETSAKSGLGYNLLGLLIERVSGKSFEENIHDFSRELKLDNTSFSKEDLLLAEGYLYHNYRGRGLEFEAAPVANPNINFSSSGIKSTASDLLKIIRVNPREEVTIGGYMPDDGFSYSINYVPHSGRSIIVLSNNRHPVGGEISRSIEAILAGEEYRLPLLRKPYAIAPSLLDDYAGSYSINEQMNLQVLAEGDSLFVLMGQNKVQLIPQATNQFYMEQGDAALRFHRDSTGMVHEVELLDGFLDGNKIKKSN